jgi:preprotein translocase subunit SecG
MNTLFTVVIVVQVISALVIIGLVLLQHGKGADMGAAFGSGASGSLFGATGSSNFLSKMTAVAATVFFLSTLGLAYIGNHNPGNNIGVMQGVNAPAQQIPAPAAAPVPAEDPNQIPK